MFSLQMLSRLPLEILELVLIRTFLLLYSSDNKSDSVTSAKCRAFTVLSSVCWSWWKTLTGWPQSPTPHWVKHRIMNLTKRECTWIYAIVGTRTYMYEICSRMLSEFETRMLARDPSICRPNICTDTSLSCYHDYVNLSFLKTLTLVYFLFYFITA